MLRGVVGEGEGRGVLADPDQKNKPIFEISVFELVKIDMPLHFFCFLKLWSKLWTLLPPGGCWDLILKISWLKRNIKRCLCGNSSGFLNIRFQPLCSSWKVELSSRKFKFEFLQFSSSILILLWIAYKIALTNLFQV